MMQQEMVLILGMALVTFACRYPVLALVSRLPLPETVLRAMRFIPPAVLTAIIVPSILMPGGERIELSMVNSNLVAALAAALVAWRSKNLLLTIVVGMVILWLWRWFFAPTLV
jgi:branched-subunit amino acid transport protein